MASEPARSDPERTAPPELVRLEPGTIVAETYRIEERIGHGGMGVVYRATDMTLGRPVALKLHRRPPADAGMDRLMREASVMARLSHPHIAAVFEVGHHTEPGDDVPRLFVAMEYVDGGSVVAWAKAKPRSWRAILEVFLQAGDGLAAAHAAGVVHRDFKPDNILIDTDGRARVADFGLARLGPDGASTHEAAEPPYVDSAETRDGARLGTPAYMAPEQWQRQDATPASDQYAFCVSLFETLFDRNPLAEQRTTDPNPRGEARDVVAWTVPSTAKVPARIVKTLRRGLAVAPGERFATMSELLAALRHEPWPLAARVAALTGAVGTGAAVASLVLAPAPPADCESRAELAEILSAALLPLSLARRRPSPPRTPARARPRDRDRAQPPRRRRRRHA